MDSAIRTLSTSFWPSIKGSGQLNLHSHLHNGGFSRGHPELVSPDGEAGQELHFSHGEVRRSLCEAEEPYLFIFLCKIIKIDQFSDHYNTHAHKHTYIKR